MLLSNKVAIVTGGARGIGKGIVLKFVEEGAIPVIADIIDEEGNETLEEVKSKGSEGLYVHCDVSNNTQVANLMDQTIQKFGRIDILVNNAGVGSTPRSIVEMPEEEWDRVLAINLKGVFLCCKTAVPYIKKQGYGKIINISSLGAINPPTACIAYTSAKMGVLGLTLDLALELAPSNICVNAILPGAVPSVMWDKIIPPGVDKQAFLEATAKIVAPMQRLGTPEDIAGAALFLASHLSDYVTGDRIIVGGGSPLKPQLPLQKESGG